jgi:DNA-binding MarR family transcriptional regulator
VSEKLLKEVASDKIVHERSRLLILTYLASSDEAEVKFTELKDKLEMTAGNLSVQLKTLRKAGYVSIRKQFKDDKPLTTASVTPRGRKALEDYVAAMEQIIATFKAGK